jgi:hypothetical protein
MTKRTTTKISFSVTPFRRLDPAHKETVMKNRFASAFVLAATILAGAAQAASIEKKEYVTLDRTAVVGGSVLPAGNYRVKLAIDPDTATFLQGRRVVAEAPCKVRPAQVFYRGDAVHYLTGDGGHDRLIKLVFASSRLAIEFPTDLAVATVATDSPTATEAVRQ